MLRRPTSLCPQAASASPRSSSPPGNLSASASGASGNCTITRPGTITLPVTTMGVPRNCRSDVDEAVLPPAKRPRLQAAPAPVSDNGVPGEAAPCSAGLPPAKQPRILRRSSTRSRVRPRISTRSSRRSSNQWVSISMTSAVSTSAIVPASSHPDTEMQAADRTTPCGSTGGTTCGGLPSHHSPAASPHPSPPCGAISFRFQNYFTTPISLRLSPLPSLHWADSRELWEAMLRKEELYVRDSSFLDRHATLQARMRSILLDWLIEVCEVYRLHRETFYLAVDFIDRYLSQTLNIHKQQLQLLGITALFIAAKLEEIYPPRLAEFAYVSDGACTVSEILEQELVILKQLKWDLSPLTVNAWLNVYMQLVNLEGMEEKEHSFIIPQYSQHAFVQIARLLDLCFLDFGCIQFSYSVLATAAVYHITSEAVALAVSGYKWVDMAACAQWMAPFATTLREEGPTELRFFSQVATDDAHNIQTHDVDLQLLERCQTRQTQVETSSRASPDYSKVIPGVITPPQSKGKQRAYD